jgi:hypothetical protein
MVVREISRVEFTPSWAIVGGAVGDDVKSGIRLAFGTKLYDKSELGRTFCLE